MTNIEKLHFIAEQNAIIQKEEAFKNKIKREKQELIKRVYASIKEMPVRVMVLPNAIGGNKYHGWITGLTFNPDRIVVNFVENDGTKRQLGLESVSGIEE